MTIYDFTVTDNKGKAVSLSDYQDKVVMIVNTATKCGLTPQYDRLEKWYIDYKDQGFEILDFPCNQFLEQAPGEDDAIDSFCTLNYGTTFPRFKKIEVNGDNADPLYRYLKEEQPVDIEDDEAIAFAKKVEDIQPLAQPSDIKWNFGKFLIDRKGNVVKRFSPTYLGEELENSIQKLLAEK